MKAKYPITSYTCPMCNKSIDAAKDMLERNFEEPEFIVESYTCSGCGHKGRIFFGFAGQEGLPIEHQEDEDWSYGEKVEPPDEGPYADSQGDYEIDRRLGEDAIQENEDGQFV